MNDSVTFILAINITDSWFQDEVGSHEDTVSGDEGEVSDEEGEASGLR